MRVDPRLVFTLLVGLAVACGGAPSSVPVSRATAPPGGRVLLDFPAHLDNVVVRHARTRYRFGAEGRSDVLLDGWSTPEQTGDGEPFVWATAERARLRLHLLDGDSRWLHFAAHPFRVGPTVAQTVTVRVNDVEVGKVTLDGGPFEEYSLAVPDAAVTIGDTIVTFDFAYAVSPSSLAMGTRDDRTLAAAFGSVAMTSDPTPPPRTGPTDEPEPAVSEGERMVLPTGAEAVFPFVVPPDGIVEFTLAPAGSDGTTPVRAEVALRTANREEEVFFVASPDDDTSWHADLSAWTGTSVALAFRVVGGEPTDRVAWVRPRLYGDPGSVNSTTNVLLIVVDTLRADALGVYGGDAHTPVMDGLARTGARFERAYSHIPITVPSHSSMFTSLLPSEHAARNNGSILGEAHLTLAELLRDHYRRTAGFVSLGVLGREFGVAQGFGEYHDEFGADWWKRAADMNAQLLPWLEGGPPSPFFLWAHYSDPHEPYSPPGRDYTRLRVSREGETVMETLADGTVATAELEFPPGRSPLTLARVDGGGGPPIRLNNLRTANRELTVTCDEGCRARRPGPRITEFVTTLPATVVVDNPTDRSLATTLRLQTSEDLSNREARLRYREEVEYLDRELADLLATVASVSDDTLVILTADHGEDLGEHGSPGHVSRLYESVIRVPWLIRWPGRIEEGLVVEEPVAHIDLLPTLLDLLGIPDTATRSGRSLAPWLLGSPDPPPEVPVFAETFRPESPQDRRAVVATPYKLIESPDESRLELYDLRADPAERENLATVEPDTTASLTRVLRTRIIRAEAQAPPVENQPLTDEQIERLRSLGYVR